MTEIGAAFHESCARILQEDLQSGPLQTVLTEHAPTERNLHALYLPNRRLSAKVRMLIDFLVARFSAEPYCDRDWAVTRTSGGRRKPRERSPH